MHPNRASPRSWASLVMEDRRKVLSPLAGHLPDAAQKLAKSASCWLFVAGSIWVYRVLACICLHLLVDYLRYSFDSRFADVLLGCSFAVALKLELLEPVLAAVGRIKTSPLWLAGILVGLTMRERHMSDRTLYGFAYRSLRWLWRYCWFN